MTETNSIPGFVQAQADRAQASREKMDKIRQDLANQKASVTPVPGGVTKVDATRKDLGSKPFHDTPENVLLGEKRTDSPSY